MIKKEKIGVVVSNKCDKTIIVAVQMKYQHSRYKKTLIKTKRYMAHDELNLCQEGDIVLIEENIPISRHKKWILKQIFKL